MFYLITYYNGGSFTNNTVAKRALVEIKREVTSTRESMEAQLEARQKFLAEPHNKANKAEIIACQQLNMDTEPVGIFFID